MANFSRGFIDEEWRCVLCDHRLGRNGDAHDERCVAARLPWGLTVAAPGRRLPTVAGIALEQALHGSYASLFDLALELGALDDAGPCPGCAGPAVTALVPVGRNRCTDLSFYMHSGDCALQSVPACWIVGLGATHTPIPLDPTLTNQYMGSRQAAEQIAPYVPEEERRCPLCVGRLVRPDGIALHRDRCLAASAPAAVLKPTPGLSLQVLLEAG